MFFGCSEIKSLDIPSGTNAIGKNAFTGCSGMEGIVIPDSVKTVEKGSFYDCGSLAQMTVPCAYGGYLGYMFGASSYSENSTYVPNTLKEIVFTDKDAFLESNALYRCSSLEKVRVDNETVKTNAFRECAGLKEVTLSYKVINISSPFTSCPSGMVVLGYADTAAQESARNNTAFTFKLIDGEIPHEVYKNGDCGYGINWALYYDHILELSGVGAMPDYNSYGWTEYNGYINAVKVNEGITGIGTRALSNNNNLKNVTLPNTLKKINGSAFEECRNLNNIAIPSGVVSIGSAAFKNCVELNNVLIGENVKIIDSSCFEGDIKLTEIILPKSLSEIGNNAFYGCNLLSEVVLSDGIVKIGESAFGNCTALDSIKIPYTVISMYPNTFERHIEAFTIKGYSNSYAEDYAAENKINFEAVDGSIPKTVRISGTLGSDITWELYYDGELRINGKGAMPEYSGCSNYPWYQYRNYVKSVYLSGITSVGSYAFDGYTYLKKATFGASIKRIGVNVFRNCTSLENVLLSEKLEYINNGDFYGCTSLKEIYIPETVETIYANAFSGCIRLSTVILSESLKNINDSSVGGCTAITKIEIPYTVVNINANAFKNHIVDMVIVGYRNSYAEDYAEDYDFVFEEIKGSMPDEVRAEGKIGNDILWKLKYDGTLIISGVGAIASYTASGYGYYNYNTFIKNVVFEKGITSVGNNMFNGYSRLRSVTLPDGLLSVGAYAFNNCRLLKKIVIPNTVTDIYQYAFNKCSELSDVSMSEKITNIYDYAFSECTMLNDIFISYSANQISNTAFNEHSSSFVIKGYAGTYAETYAQEQKIAFADIGQNVPDVERASGEFGADFTWSLSYNGMLTVNGTGMMPSYSNESYYGWNKYKQYITNVTIGKNVTSVGAYAFANIANLVSADLNDDISIIENNAFSGCNHLTNIKFLKKLQTIGEFAFSSCVRLAEINLPNGLKEIKECAFDNCTALGKIYIPYTVVKLYNNTFSNCVASLVLRGYEGSYAEDFSRDNNITFEKLDEKIPDEIYVSGEMNNGFSWSLTYGGKLTVNGKGSMITSNGSAPWIRYAQYIRSVVIGEGITTIGNYAFAACTKLREISTPKTLRTIDSYTFYNDTSLEKVNMAEEVSNIGSYAFAGCGNLVGVILPNSVYRLNDYAFADCSRLSDVTLGTSLNVIGNYCFSNNMAIKTITILASVNSIGNNAFYNHLAGLKILCYSKTYAEDYAKDNKIAYDIIDADAPDGVFKEGSFGDFDWSISYTGELKIDGVGSIPENSGNNWSSYTNYIKSLTVADGISGFGANTFNNLNRLESVSLANSVKSIGKNAFENDSVLKTVLAMNVESIGDSAFKGCAKIENLQLSNCLKTIGSYAFSGCTEIRYFELPVGTRTIGDNAFEKCTSMEYVLIPYTVTNIGYNITANHKDNFAIKGYENSYVQSYANKNKIDFEILEKTPEIIMDSGKIDEDFSWSLDYSGILTISGAGMMPDKSSYDWQKYNYMINSLKLEDGITTVGNYLCSGLVTLKNVYLPKSIKVMGSYSFYDCRVLETVSIPENTVRIANNAFEKCYQINYIHIGKNVSYIGEQAFNLCTKLSKVYYGGNSEPWNKIAVGTNNLPLNNAEKVYDASKINYDFLGYRQGKDYIVAQVRVLNAAEDDMAVLAVYKDNKLLKLVSQKVSSDIIQLKQPFNEGETARLYIWNVDMTPYISAEEYSYCEIIGGYQDVVLETPHDYYNGMNEWYVYEYEGEAQSIDVTFSADTFTEGCDYIYIYDKNDTLIGQYSGSALAGKTVNIPGNMIKINFKTDGSVVYYGFRTDSIYVNV